MVEYRINVGDRIKIPGICNNLVSVLGFIVRINALTLGKKLNNRLKMDRTIDGCNCKNDGVSEKYLTCLVCNLIVNLLMDLPCTG